MAYFERISVGVSYIVMNSDDELNCEKSFVNESLVPLNYMLQIEWSVEIILPHS